MKSRNCGALKLLAGLLLVASVSTRQAVAETVLDVSAASSLDKQAAVTWQLPESLRSAQGFRLIAVESGQDVPVQRLTGEPDRVMWLLEEPLATGATRRYQLSADNAAETAAPQDHVRCEDDGRRLLVSVAGQSLLQYNSDAVEPPEGIAKHFRRSGYLHPVFAPSGAVVTDDFAPDHAHQHGVFFAWVSTTFQGREVDFWNQAKRQGNVEHAEVLSTTSGPVWGGFQVRLRHVDLSVDESQTVLEETWTVRAHRRSDVFVFDLESRQKCVADSPLRINEYHYGGMALRGSRQWYSAAAEGPSASADAIPGGFLTSEGKHRRDGNHSRPDWVSAYGPAGDGQSTITVMSHPQNFQHPQSVRLHPTKPYLCFAPMVLGEFEISPDETYVSRYRYAIHDGPPDVERNRRLWSEYAEAPTVTRATSGG